MSEQDNDSWQLHADEQAKAWLRLSYAQRLQWLEQAKEFAQLALQAAAARRKLAQPQTQVDSAAPCRPPKQ